MNRLSIPEAQEGGGRRPFFAEGPSPRGAKQTTRTPTCMDKAPAKSTHPPRFFLVFLPLCFQLLFIEIYWIAEVQADFKNNTNLFLKKIHVENVFYKANEKNKTGLFLCMDMGHGEFKIQKHQKILSKTITPT
jgi:hypothetical protein